MRAVRIPKPPPALWTLSEPMNSPMARSMKVSVRKKKSEMRPSERLDAPLVFEVEPAADADALADEPVAEPEREAAALDEPLAVPEEAAAEPEEAAADPEAVAEPDAALVTPVAAASSVKSADDAYVWQLLDATTVGVYGMLVISPSDSGGCSYDWVAPDAST